MYRATRLLRAVNSGATPLSTPSLSVFGRSRQLPARWLSASASASQQTPTVAATQSPATDAATASHPHRHYAHHTVLGSAPEADMAFDFRKAYVGQQIEIPYEVTIDPSWKDIWHSAFHQYDRLYTSKEFARQLGFDNQLLPFSLMLFYTSSMSHLDDNREILDIGYNNAVYEHPAYPGSTFQKSFIIKGLRPTKEGDKTVVTVRCELWQVEPRQRVFSMDKTILYPLPTNPTRHSRAPDTEAPLPDSPLQQHLVRAAAFLPPSKSLVDAEPGKLLLHGMSRPIGDQNMELSTLFRLIHPLVYNTARYKPGELVVAGGLLLASSMASSSRGLFEVLNESIVESRFFNTAMPTDTIGSFSYILDSRTVEGDLQEITLQTFGVKNLDVCNELKHVRMPVSMFGRAVSRSEIEKLCVEHVPQLKGRLCVSSIRKIYRQSPYQLDLFLL